MKWYSAKLFFPKPLTTVLVYRNDTKAFDLAVLVNEIDGSPFWHIESTGERIKVVSDHPRIKYWAKIEAPCEENIIGIMSFWKGLL